MIISELKETEINFKAPSMTGKLILSQEYDEE